MAWNIHWQIPFADIDNTCYMIYIYEQGYVGNVVQLIGSDEPFVTQEYNNSDIFTPVRGQTGYIGVIDDTANGDLLSQLIPQNNTEKMVRLYTGTWNGNTFTPSTIMWQGFLAASAYSQKWGKRKKEIQIPVNSILESLKYVEIPDSIIKGLKRIGALFYIGITNGLNAEMADVYVCTSINDAKQFLAHYVDINCFFEKIVINNEGDETDVYRSRSMYNIFSDVASLFSVVFRENGNSLYVVQCNDAGLTNCRQWLWSDCANMVNDTVADGTNIGTPSTANLLESVTINGMDTDIEFNQGAVDVKVEVLLVDTQVSIVSLPQTTEDASQVYRFDKYVSSELDSTLFIQPHEPRSTAVETYTFRKFTIESENHYWDDPGVQGLIYYYLFDAASNYANCVDFDIINIPTRPISGADGVTPAYTGAFPVRWFIQEDGEDVRLRSGLLLSLLPAWKTDTFVQNNKPLNPGYYDPNYKISSIYEIRSAYETPLTAGSYLILNVKMAARFIEETNWSKFSGSSSEQESYYALRCHLKVDNKYLRNDFRDIHSTCTWSDTDYGFYVFIDTASGKIFNNKPEGLDIDEDEGFFIPIGETPMSGVVSFSFKETELFLVFSDSTYLNPNIGWPGMYYKFIVSDIELVNNIPNNLLTVSERTSNIYYQKILSAGFSDEESVSINIGTFNNNLPSASFLRQASNVQTYLETLEYIGAENATYEQRPELFLLQKMAKYYEQIRERLVLPVKKNINLQLTRYLYSNKYFIGFCKRVKWRDNKQDVEFIEVTN